MSESRSATRLLRTFGPACLAWFLTLCAAGSTSQAGEPWPRFRGPNGSGISELKGVPVEWTAEDYEWVVELPGLGHSAPVVWDDALFVTSGKDDGTRTLTRLDAATGNEVWSQAIRLAPSHLHKKNSYASGTPALDGKNVYVVFADDDHNLVQAYTFAGDLLWNRDLGAFASQHGQGVSPIVHNGNVIVPNDQRGPSSIVALDAGSGDVVWEQSNRGQKEVSYSTPFLLDVGGKEQLVCLSGAMGISGLDPLTGAEIWSSGELPKRTVASPVYGGGVIIATCGQGGIGKYMVAVDPTGRGNVSASHVRYERLEDESLPYVPTPIAYDGHFYLWCDRGIVCCVEPATGKTVWRERIGGNFSGSPILIDGKLYCMSEEGEVVVVAASPEYHFYGRSPLGEESYSTPAVGNDRVYFRGFQKLACLRAVTE